jgi:hypothetical protein
MTLLRSVNSTVPYLAGRITHPLRDGTIAAGLETFKEY